MITDSVLGRLQRLRDDFDRSFEEPARSHDVEHVELLAVRAGGRPYAIRLSQSAGLHPDRPVVPLPGPLPALLGLAGFAGTVVPVYDLAAVLGHPIAERPRWLVLTAGSPALGLAFHDLDGHLQVPASAIVGESSLRGCVRGVVELEDGARPIADLVAVRAAVHTLTGHDPLSEETRR